MNKLTHIEPAAPGAREARTLSALYDDAQSGMRRVVAVGLFAHEIKSQLKHGQFGHWLQEHAPELCRVKDDKPQATASLLAYMQLAYGVLESAGFKLGEYLKSSNPQALGISHGGEILTLPDAKVPDEVRPIREKICALIDGKTQRQLFAEFKSAEDDEGEGIKVGSPLGKHHPRKAAAPSPQEQLKAKVAAQETAAHIILGDIRTFLRSDNALVRAKVWQALLDIGVELTTTCRERLKSDPTPSRRNKLPHVSHTVDTLNSL